MIPYEDLERALARWRSRSRDGATPEPTGEGEGEGEVVELGTAPHNGHGFPPAREQTGEIDIGDEVVESIDVHRH